ncbi:MAG: hypothetical protein HWN80_11325 [Candidatus Lokiarchaeota archaeon]|nr:hypothetical protein [Candidatus Lokiarchaeota archaeon]
MEENLLTKFLKLMSKDISESDLELVPLGRSLGLDLISFAELRASQEDGFIDRVRAEALKRLGKHNDNVVSNNNSFYAGSIDFMVSNDPESKQFFLLETNGGSNRGLSILTKKQQALLYDGYYESISQVIEMDKGENGKVLVVVGVPINDGLIHEKVIMVEYLRKKIKSNGYSLKIFNSDNYDKEHKAKVVFIISDYKQLNQTLSFSNGWVWYLGERVHVLIGDGIARRLSDKNFEELIRKDFRRINTQIVNPIFRITDDKSLTYVASFLSRKVLKKYGLAYLRFTKASSEKELILKVKYLIKNYNKSFMIKPSGGSGGAGVIPILQDDKPKKIKKIIKESKEEFYTKFSRSREPFPYTIQEKADFSLINWEGGKHTFDLRIYLAQSKNQIIPIGGLARIARGNFVKGLNKQEFVVNLSGYDGKIEVNRGVGFSEKNSRLLDLTFEDFVNAFCIGSVIFKTIIENYNEIMEFSDWDKIIS